MLRRRIFSSAMASVLALSSIAVVAQADETKMVVDKAQLKELIEVTYGDTWRADELSNYGSISAAAMLDALEAADVILADGDSKDDDYTVAYMMVKAVADRLVIHTAEELKALIDECQPIIDTNNIYNPELQDQIYNAVKFGNLEDMLDYAKAFVTSTSSSDITEAWELLNAAKEACLASKNPVVSKSMFRNVLKQYDEILDDQFAYDSWRRGSMAWVNTSNGNYWTFASNGASNATFGHYYEYVKTLKAQIVSAYDQIDAIKGLTKTTDAEIYAGYVMAQDAIAVYNGWSADDVNKATKAGLSSLISKYHGQLIHEYASDDVNDLLAAIQAKVAADTVISVAADTVATNANLWATEGYWEKDWGWDSGINKVVKAEAVIKITDTNIKAVYVPVTEDGYYDDTRAIVTTKEEKTADGGKFQTISVNSKFDIADLIDITGKVDGSGDVASDANDTLDSSDEWGYSWATPIAGYATGVATWDNAVSLEKAMKIAELYINGTKAEIALGTDILDIDDTGVIAADPTGSSKEYQLAYRYLYYALTEKYEGTIEAGCSHTRADVKGLIEDAWDLITDTGDAAIFNATNVDLVEARQAAMKWVAQANSDKLYKEHQPGVAADSTAYVSSDDAYHALEAAYGKLKAEYDALNYSFGEIYDALADAANDIDDGKLEATDELLAAMDQLADALSKVDPITYVQLPNDEYLDNAAFDVDRVFCENNRVITNSGDPVAIQEMEGSVTTKDGANPTHAALVAAFNAMKAAIAAQSEVEVVNGDANGDGAVTPADAAAILKFCVGLAEIDEKAAEFDGVEGITPADAAAILKYCVQ